MAHCSKFDCPLCRHVTDGVCECPDCGVCPKRGADPCSCPEPVPGTKGMCQRCEKWIVGAEPGTFERCFVCDEEFPLRDLLRRSFAEVFVGVRGADKDVGWICYNCDVAARKDTIGLVEFKGQVIPIPVERVEPKDEVDHPAHYTHGKIEVIDFIEDQGFGFHLAQVIKYVSRAGHKGDIFVDLRKARWYLDRYITFLEKSACKEKS